MTKYAEQGVENIYRIDHRIKVLFKEMRLFLVHSGEKIKVYIPIINNFH